MAYLDYPGLSYFKSLLDETYLRTSYTGDTTIAGDVTFTGDTIFSEDIAGNVDGKTKKDWRDQQIDSTYIKDISVNDNAGQIVYTKGDGTSNYIMIDIMQGATAFAAGKAGLVPAPTISERTKFLRGDGEWSVPTDIYVTQNLINTNDSFPILIGATAGATQSQIGTAIAFGTKVSVNPNTHALIADHLILKHPTYRRSNNVSSKIMYTLNFADSDDGNGNNLSEIYGYIDPVANGGEHELGFRLFGNPNVQGVEEIFTYLSVGLSKTNVPYGHAPSTPLPADHNEPTDIITRDWLARNGSETGLVHTSMNETISGIKTFTDKIVGTGTAEISGGSGNTPSLKVTGNETVTGDLNVGGNETVAGNISTVNGTVSGKTGSIGTGGLTVTGPSNLNGKVTADNGLDVAGNTETDTLTVNGNETVGGTLTVTGKITGNGGAEISGGNGFKVNGDETVTGKLTAEDLEATDDLTVGDTATIGGTILKKTGTNTTQEYVSYVTNQQETRNTIITNVVKPNGGLAIVGSGVDKGKIYVDTGDGLSVDTNGKINVNFQDPDPEFIEGIVNGMIPRNSNGDYIGGLSTIPLTDPVNGGKLIVDFSQIDQATKEAILEGLSMQIPLESGLNLWVDINTGSDTLDENRGTPAKPFKSIQACINYATQKYAVGAYNIVIHIKSGTYTITDTIVLPSYTRTSGTCYLVAEDGYGTVTITANQKVIGLMRATQNAIWRIRGIAFDMIVPTPDDNIPHHLSCLSSAENSTLYIESCTFSARYVGAAHTQALTCNCANAARNSTWNFLPSNLGPITFHCEKGNATSGSHLIIDTGSALLFNKSNTLDSSSNYVIGFSGDVTYVFSVSANSRIEYYGGALYTFTFGVPLNKTLTCEYKYRVISSSYMNVGLTTNPIPGEGNTNIDTATYCWVK